MAKNSYYVELKRYLAEVSVGARTLMLPTLAERVDKAYQSGVGTLDICELFSQYALSSAKLSKQTKNYFAKSEKFLKEHRALEKAQRSLSLDNLEGNAQRTPLVLRDFEKQIQNLYERLVAQSSARDLEKINQGFDSAFACSRAHLKAAVEKRERQDKRYFATCKKRF